MTEIELVQQIKDDLIAKGVDLKGPCGAFEITKRWAWAKRAEGYGLAWKGGGNNCKGWATDITMKADGTHWDLLGGGGDGDGIHDGNKPEFNMVVYTADDPDPAHKPLIGQPFKRPEMFRPAFIDWIEEIPTPDGGDGNGSDENGDGEPDGGIIAMFVEKLTSIAADIKALRTDVAQLQKVQSWGVSGKVPYLGNAQFLPIEPKKNVVGSANSFKKSKK